MVNSVAGSQLSGILAGVSSQETSPSGSTTSFTDQLAAALEGYLSQASSGSHLEIDIQTTQSQNSGVRQFIVTVKDPEAAASQPSAQGTPTSASSSASSAPATPANHDTASVPTNEIDAYWAAQPPAVRQLREISDLTDRTALAQQLANQGYTIDTAIMVWGWDPLKTMQTRMAYGYTWAPSFNQGNVSTPGLALTGQIPYDPDHPPAGSILVNTDFANGLTDPTNV